MRNKKVTKIIGVPIQFDYKNIKEYSKKVRVAAYARVSTLSELQETSLEAQRSYYENYIRKNSKWSFVNVYYDDGISGLSYHRRDGFNKMINDAMAGKIDLILTKSISRFARNTVDTLVHIRKLKGMGVEVYFEKEDIYTFDSKGEFLITLMSSLAQEESRSLSENITWGQRKRFADGKYAVPYSRFLGYDKSLKNEMAVNCEEAKIVRLIYCLYLNGYSATGISNFLNQQKIRTVTGCDTWRKTVINSILCNEKYKGDALLQKEYTIDYLSKKRKKNEGEVPQYYVKHGHEPIVSYEISDLVQLEIENRKVYDRSYSSVATFSTLLRCKCGAPYGHRTMHANTKYESDFWVCSSFYKEGSHSPKIHDYTIRKATSVAVRELLKEYKQEMFDAICKITSNNTEINYAKIGASLINKDVFFNDQFFIRGIIQSITIDEDIAFNFINNKIIKVNYNDMRAEFKKWRKEQIKK